MKKRIALLILAIVCLVGVCIVAASADGEPATAIPGHNLALEDCVNIIYYASFENIPVGAETGVLVWTSAQDAYTYGQEEAKLTANGKYNQYDKFFYGVPAKMMSQDIYAVSYIKNGEEITYSALDKYSVLQYAYNKKGSTSVLLGGSATLGELLLDMLDYGARAQKYFGYNTDRLANATYYQITVEGGTLPDGTTKGLYKAGESVTLNATVGNFDHWENSANETVGNTITVAGAETFTAIAGSGQAEPGTDPIEIEEPPVYSEGLHFSSYGDGSCWVSGIGTCSDVNIVIPPTSPDGDVVTAIGFLGGAYPNTFTENPYIQSVAIPASVTAIGEIAFLNCINLKQVVFAKESQLVSIENDAFYGCTNLLSIELPNNLESIGNSAFGNCSNLTLVKLPASLTSIGNNAFFGCSSLLEISVAEGNPIYHSAGNCIIETASKTLIAGCKNSAIPSDGSVTSIGECAFYAHTSLTSITIPDGVTSIGFGAVRNCTSLTSITIPDSVTSIGSYAFYFCTSLTSITFQGTEEQWNAISKGTVWDDHTGSYTIHCTDGDIAK